MGDFLAQIIPFVYIGIIIYLANQQAAAQSEGPLLKMLLYSTAVLPFVYMFFTMAATEPEGFSASAWTIALVMSIGFSALSLTVIRSPRFRHLLTRWFRAAYQPDSPVHLTALVLILALASFTLSNFFLSGGISGLAESMEMDESAIPNLVLTEAIWILTALLGVGLMIRRSPAQTAARLGLRFPKPEDFNWGLGYGLLTYVLVIAFIGVWTLLTSPEQFAEQTAAAQQLGSIFTSIPQAFVLSLLIGFGEELFFRGALQPIFGIGFTSVFFTLLHTQYTLTPATLALFVVSLVLGWLRQRQSTTAAIIAHFIYNFVQLALGILIATP
jgi:membrane protease YdiL (CAAX protease family)